MKLVDLGYAVYFKAGDDEELEAQLEAYCLAPAYLDKIKITRRIDSSVMEDIDMVAGTMTTLVYELLPYGKTTWVLETEYRHLEDLVEGGFAHKIRYEELGNLDERCFSPARLDGSYFFSPEPLAATLQKHVHDDLSRS